MSANQLAASVAVLGLWVLFGVVGYAVPTSESEAAAVAERVIEAHAELWDIGIVLPEGGRPISVHAEGVRQFLDADGQRLLGYIVELAPRGFVIVSGDTDLRPVIAYSFDDDFTTQSGDESSVLCDMLTWDLTMGLDGLGGQVRVENQKVWTEQLTGPRLSVLGKTQWPVSDSGWLTTTWGQGSPSNPVGNYNARCPLDPVTGQRCYTGCTATAMGQVVAYWQYPSSIALTGSYISNTDPDGPGSELPRVMTITRSDANIGSITWNGGNPSMATIADLLFACGVSVDMNYSDQGSGAWVENIPGALLGPFGFASATVARPSEPDFYDRLRANMRTGRPAVMHISAPGNSPQDPRTQHTIAVDGYNDVDDAFHLNFGWGNTAPDAIGDCWYTLPAMPGSTHGYDMVHVAALDISPPEGVCAMLVIDRSGSMDQRELTRLEQAKAAAQYFVAASRAGDWVGVSAFETNGSLVQGLTRIGSSAASDPAKASLNGAIAGITSGDRTNFGAGLQIAYDQLNGSATANDKLAVLMSDGVNNQGSYTSQVAAFAAKGWPIFTIAFGAGADRARLRTIAEDTDGEAYDAQTDDLTVIYDTILAQVQGGSVFATLRGWIGQGLTRFLTLPWTPGGLFLRVLLSWSGSELDMNLIAPDGTVITPGIAGTDPNIDYSESPTSLFYTVQNPQAGVWQVELHGTDVPQGYEPYIVNASTAGGMVANFKPFQAQYDKNATVNIGVTLETAAGQPILGASVGATVGKPSGAVSAPFSLFDDGAHNDGAANDGWYGAQFSDTDEDGIYRISAAISSPESLELVYSVVVGQNVPNPCLTEQHTAASSGWHMLAVPGTLCDLCVWGAGCGDVACALGHDIDPFYAYRYDPTAGTYTRVTLADPICYEPGMGFWTYTWESDTQLAVDVTLLAGSVDLALQIGWNQVGDPYSHAIAAGALRVRNGAQELTLPEAQAQGWADARLYSYDTATGAYVEIDGAAGCIPAWTGCWLRTFCDGCALVFQPVGCAAPMAGLRTLSASEARALELPPPPPIAPQAIDVQEVLAGLSARNVPNPVRSEHTTMFRVEGVRADAVEGMRVDIYDLNGRLVFTQQIAARELAWHTVNNAGELLANGVYLYQVWVEVAGAWYPMEVEKLALYR